MTSSLQKKTSRFQKQKTRKTEDFLKWIDKDVELLLESIKDYKSKHVLRKRGGLGECKAEVMKKYVHSSSLTERMTSDMLHTLFTKQKIATKVKSLRQSYRKAVDRGRKVAEGESS